MGLINWADRHCKNLDIWDIGAIKWASLLVGIIIGAYIANFTKQYLWWFIIAAILLVIRPIKRCLTGPNK